MENNVEISIVDLEKHISATEVLLNELYAGTLHKASSKWITTRRKEFTMNFDAVSFKLDFLIAVLKQDAKGYFGNSNLRFITADKFKKVFVRGLEFNEMYATGMYSVDTRLFYSRLFNSFIPRYTQRYNEWYNTLEKIVEKKKNDETVHLRDRVKEINKMKRRHLVEAVIGKEKFYRLIQIEEGDRLQDHLEDLFGPNWEDVVKAALFCNIHDVLIEKTSEVVFNQYPQLEEIS